jgi:hypothetical protein
MLRPMPPVATRFGLAAEEALALAQVGEQIRALSPLGSIARKELRAGRIEALYETAYLRVFLIWEDFLEQSFFRFLCGYSCSTGAPILRQKALPSLAVAANTVLGTRDYVPWANPNAVIGRSQKFITRGNHELVLNSNLARLEAFNAVRNRIAHRSEYARREFDNATNLLAARRFPGSSAGRFLRHIAVAAPTPESWLHHICEELKSLAVQICP